MMGKRLIRASVLAALLAWNLSFPTPAVAHHVECSFPNHFPFAVVYTNPDQIELYGTSDTSCTGGTNIIIYLHLYVTYTGNPNDWVELLIGQRSCPLASSCPIRVGPSLRYPYGTWGHTLSTVQWEDNGVSKSKGDGQYKCTQFPAPGLGPQGSSQSAAGRSLRIIPPVGAGGCGGSRIDRTDWTQFLQ